MPQQGVPIILNSARPARNRGRQNSEHPNRQPLYYSDQNGNLMVVPGRPGRSSSISGGFIPSANVIVNNHQWEEHSPARGHSRRNSHGNDHHYSDDDDWDDRHRRRRHSRTPSPFYDSEIEERLRKLKKLEQKEEEEAARERYEEEQILKEARKAKKKKEEEEMLKQAIKERELKALEEKAKAEKKKKEEDEAFRERTIKTFAAAGYSEGSIEKILKKAEGKGKDKRGEKQIMDLTRPTYIKVHRKHLSPDTLDEYDLPWEWDDVSISHSYNACSLTQAPIPGSSRAFQSSRHLISLMKPPC